MEIVRLNPKQCLPFLARLRVEVFREYPYLYDGNLAYEGQYLDRYARSPEAQIWGLAEHNQLIGAITGMPMAQEDPALRDPYPFEAQKCFYIGEVLLLPAYRSHGYGTKLIQTLLDNIDTVRYPQQALYSVQEPFHPAPEGYVCPEPLWKKFAFEMCGHQAQFSWKRIDRQAEESHTMKLWVRNKPK